MATRQKNKQFNFKIAIVLVVIILVILILGLIIVKLNGKGDKTNIEKLNAEYLVKREQEIKADLSEMSEQQRIEYYCGYFFRLIDSQKYEDAYNLLYSEYKENYFPNLANFKNYFKEYFPDDLSLSYNNIERLGDIYVLWVSINDAVNGSKYGHNFNLYVVVKENALNDFVISFSRNSAVEGLEE